MLFILCQYSDFVFFVECHYFLDFIFIYFLFLSKDVDCETFLLIGDPVKFTFNGPTDTFLLSTLISVLKIDKYRL